MIHLFTSIPGRLVVASALSILILSFGDALIFDRVFLAIMLLATIVSFPINKDTFSILVIICFCSGFEELHWLIIVEELFVPIDTQSIWLKLYCYILCFISCYMQRDETLTKLIFPVIAIAAVFEAYWFVYDLPGKQIYWYVFVTATVVLGRHILFWRPHILHRKFPNLTDWTYSRLDADFELFLKLMLILESVMIVEYLLRYTTGNNQIIYVYHSYAFFAHAINLYLLFSAFLEIKSNYSNRHLHA